MRLTAFLLAVLATQAAHADTITVAVASNFRGTAEALAAQFTAQSGHEIRTSTASTGHLYAQILHGAPFDVFLAADARHPALLEEAGIGVPGSRATYAVGALVLWSADHSMTDCRAALDDLGERRLAIANPGIAPYGRAAQQFLEKAGLWDRVLPRIVYGENIQQALHFVVSGNAQLAIVAKAQAIDPRLPAAACSWPVPATMHEALQQQVILLARAAHKPAAQQFLRFLQGSGARATIRASGYGVP